MNRRIIFGGLLFLFFSSISLSFPFENKIKVRIAQLVGGGDHHSIEEENRLCLENPDLLEELIFEEKEIHYQHFVRHNSFVGIQYCCSEGKISTERFMDIVIRLIKKVSEKALPHIASYEMPSYRGGLGHFGYINFLKKHYIPFPKNVVAFTQCVKKMRQYNLIFSEKGATEILGRFEIFKNLVEADSPKINSERISLLKDLIVWIEKEGDKIMNADAKMVLPVYLQTLIEQSQDLEKAQ